MKLIINGEDTELEVSTIEDIITHYGFSASQLVIELNRKIVKRELFSTTTVSEGDEIEIVRIVGGG